MAKISTKWLFYIYCIFLHGPLIIEANLQANNNVDEDVVLVNKCCEKFEIFIDSVCSQVHNESERYKPKFKNYEGEYVKMPVKYKFVIGLPICGSMQTWPIYDNQKSLDKLHLLDDGKLRHYTKGSNDKDSVATTSFDDFVENSKTNSYDYERNQYCIDRAISTNDNQSEGLFVYVCFAQKEIKWTDSSFLMGKIVNPIFHVISIVILLFIAIVYFILPTLRDLVGNIITTIAVCLMVAQASDLVRIFTELTSHVSFIVADIILYFSILASFFWLNSFGYYIWKTFRSRNVFLRVTDARKYCYYSFYAWGSTACMAVMAVFAHFFLDADTYKQENVVAEQETMGWLGIAIFFAPIACTIVIDIFFYVTTLKLINRRNVYGRIQHKLKANFIMFSLMLLVLSINWLFFCMSWFKFEGLLYAHIIVNALQSPLLLYICIMRQKHVTFLLKKSCCYNEPPSSNDWGDEMHYMNCNDY